MNYSFEYIDIILLAMIAGFIFLRLRGILGKRTGFEGKTPQQFQEIIKNISPDIVKSQRENFDERAKKDFLKGAQIAYETIITDFSDDDNKLIKSKPLLSQKIQNQFNEALKERSSRGHFAEITFIGVNSANIKEHKKVNNMLKVTVDFVGEVNTCIRDKDKKIISGDPDKIKKIYDTWVFSRDINSNSPNWKLIDILTQLNNKISDKDKIDWENFLKKNESLPNKDNLTEKKNNIKTYSFDLHGYSLADANLKIKDLIYNSYEKGINKLIIVTGKGLHSENEKNPYVSKDFGILKHSVPEYIRNNQDLMFMIKEIRNANIEDGGDGAFYIFLKKKL